MKKKIEFTKYDLKKKSKDEHGVTFEITNLCMVYNKRHIPFCGSCGLLKHSEFPGYCILCATYHTNRGWDLDEPAYTVEFSPYYNEDGKVILVKYDHEETFAILDNGYHNKEKVPCRLKIYKHGIGLTFLDNEN